VAPDAAADRRFGNAVSISGELAVVGAGGYDEARRPTSSAYLFRRQAGSSERWVLVKKLIGSDAKEGDFFGGAVAVSGPIVLVGAGTAVNQAPATGSAYMFSRNEGGPDNWGEVAKLLPSDATEGDRFGWEVSVSSGGVALVGAYGLTFAGDSPGSAYVFGPAHSRQRIAR
jgi:hypothetical protein